MLQKPVEEIVYENGRVVGVKSEGEVAKAPIVICDPSYVKEKVTMVGRVVRVICLLNHPIPNTGDADSVQIVIPQNQVKRKNDIYISCVSTSHAVAAKNFYVAIVATIVETDKPELEVTAALNLLGPIAEKFVDIKEIYEPVADGTTDGVFISKSYDATSHFETVCQDVKSIYKRITGNELKVEGKVHKLDETQE